MPRKAWVPAVPGGPLEISRWWVGGSGKQPGLGGGWGPGGLRAVVTPSCQPFCLRNNTEGCTRSTNHAPPREQVLTKPEANSSPSETHRQAPQSLGTPRPRGSTVTLEQRESRYQSLCGDDAGTGQTCTRVRQVTQETGKLASGAPRRQQPAIPNPQTLRRDSTRVNTLAVRPFTCPLA